MTSTTKARAPENISGALGVSARGDTRRSSRPRPRGPRRESSPHRHRSSDAVRHEPHREHEERPEHGIDQVAGHYAGDVGPELEERPRVKAFASPLVCRARRLRRLMERRLRSRAASRTSRSGSGRFCEWCRAAPRRVRCSTPSRSRPCATGRRSGPRPPPSSPPGRRSGARPVAWTGADHRRTQWRQMRRPC